MDIDYKPEFGEEVALIDGHFDYSVTSFGKVISYKGQGHRILKPGIQSAGLEQVSLMEEDGTVKKYLVHKLVWDTFGDEPGVNVSHIDGNKRNNRIDNLIPTNRKGDG